MRIALAIAAIAAASVFAVTLSGERACQEARARLFEAATGARDRSRVDGDLTTIRDRCRGASGLAGAARALRTLGRPGDAVRVARQATKAEPENAEAWRALAAVASEAEATAARRRLTALDPLTPK